MSLNLNNRGFVAPQPLEPAGVTPSVPGTAVPAAGLGSTSARLVATDGHDGAGSGSHAEAMNAVQLQTGLGADLSPDAQRYLASLSPSARLALTTLGRAVAKNADFAGASLAQTATPITAPISAPGSELQSRWTEYIGQVAQAGGAVDVNALVQSVLREAYMQTTEDLRFYAEKVSFYNNIKKQIRGELTRARQTLSQNAKLKDTDSLDPTFFGQKISTEYTGSAESLMEKDVRNYETVDAGFETGMFVGERATKGSNVDPLAIRLGDGPAVIDTPGGSFLISKDPKFSPEFSTPPGWPVGDDPPRGLHGVANQMWDAGLAAADKNGDGQISADEEKFLPPWWGGGARPAGMTEDGTASSRVVWKSPEDCLKFLVDEVKAGRITLADTALAQFNANPPNYDVGKAHISVEYYEEKRATTWFAPNMGILVDDANGDGDVQASELFGDNAMTGRGTKDGYEDLARLDVNHDGVVDGADGDGFKNLKVWQDLNSDGKVGPGELKTLASLGILSLSTNPTGGATGDKGVISTSSGMGTSIVTKGDLNNYIKTFEDKLNSVGDDAQLANVDLQNILQKQQQTLQMMSNISKMLHDTAMAVIRKIGG